VRTGTTVVRALIVFAAITIGALLMGLLVAGLLRPGAGLQVPPPVAGGVDLHRQLAGAPINGPGEFLLRMVPETFFSAFTAGDILPVLFIAGLVGLGCCIIGAAGEPIVRGLRVLARLQFAVSAFSCAWRRSAHLGPSLIRWGPMASVLSARWACWWPRWRWPASG
jgi:Na+/H+-dicarboxylate symporter